MDELWRLVEVARESDRASLPRAVEAVWRRVNYYYIWLTEDTDEVIAAMDALCDSAFPLTSADPADILDAPWPTPRRTDALLSIVDNSDPRPGPVQVDSLAERAIDSGDTRLKRLVLTSRLGKLAPATATDVLESLESVDLDLLEAAFARDFDLPCPPSLRDAYDELIWRLTEFPDSVTWQYTPTVTPARGLRFVQRGLDLRAGRLPAAPGGFEGDPYLDKMVTFLCSAELTEDERLLLPPDEPLPVPKKSISFRGSELASSPAVQAALTRAPATFRPPIDYFDALTCQELRDSLDVGTVDGVSWEFGFNDEVGMILYPDLHQEDFLEARLAAHPDIVEAFHVDREWFAIKFAREIGPDHVLAICIDAITHHYQQLAH